MEKLVEIYEQFWSYGVASGMMPNPREFIQPVPHLSFVHGEDMVDFLRKRYEGMAAHHFFQGIRIQHRP